MILRLKVLSRNSFKMVVVYLDADGEPLHYRMVGKREDIDIEQGI